MSKADELKAKNENLFECNTILLNENERLKKENEELRNNGFTVSAMTEQQLKVALKKGEQLEKENAELKADNDARKFAMVMSEKVEKQLREQIEKMKCCGNCKYSNQESAYTIVCKVGGVDKTDYIATDDNQVCDKWELREIEK